MTSDGNPFDGVGSEDLINHLESLKKKDIDAFFELVFQSIVNFPEDAILDSSPMENKKQALQRIIKHFEETEDYEKCAQLKSILDQIIKNGEANLYRDGK